MKDPTSSTSHRTTLSQSLESIVSHVDSISKQICSWSEKRWEFREFYANKLSYKQVKHEKNTKFDLCALFTNPIMNQPLHSSTKRFHIHWCNHQGIKNHFWRRWWMVFYHPPCNNNEVSQYFLRKLYCEFVLNKIPNYFDMRDF